MGFETTNQYVIATREKIEETKVENPGNYLYNILHTILQTRCITLLFFFGGVAILNSGTHTDIYIYTLGNHNLLFCGLKDKNLVI
jgi:hypothetical protein